MKLSILILEDEPEVRAALERDLLQLTPTVRIEPAEDAEDAWGVVSDIINEGDIMALALCDHRLPGTSGVDFMIEVAEEPATAATRKVLVTGQADLEDTVRALNDAHLDHYIAKPWSPENLVAVVKEQLTEYVIKAGLNPLPHMHALNAEKALEAFRDYGRAD